MNKYGVENFMIEELEYVDSNSELSEREIYWIKELGTYGSNASKGGDGTILYNHSEIEPNHSMAIFGNIFQSLFNL